MRKLGGGLGSLRHHIVDMMMDKHAADRNSAAAHSLGAGDEVGRDAQRMGSKWRTQSSEASDDFIENQQVPCLRGISRSRSR